jgi:putative transposase
MKKSRFTESQIISILKEAESGVPVAELCRKHGISNTLPSTTGGPSTAAWMSP